jgi:hypothetical protein
VGNVVQARHHAELQLRHLSGMSCSGPQTGDVLSPSSRVRTRSPSRRARREEQDSQRRLTRGMISRARPKTWPVVLVSAVRRDEAVVRARGLREARNFTPGLSALIGGAV